MPFRFFLLLLFLGICAADGYASLPVLLSASQPKYSLGRRVDFLADTMDHLTINDVRKPALARLFQPSLQETPNLVFANSSYWFRFQLLNQDVRPESRYLFEVGFGNIREIDLYLIDRTGKMTRSGRAMPWGATAGRCRQTPTSFPCRSGPENRIPFMSTSITASFTATSRSSSGKKRDFRPMPNWPPCCGDFTGERCV